MGAWIKVLGPPGTGKTSKLLEIIDELISTGVRPSNIGFISFTRAALKEVRSRILLHSNMNLDEKVDLKYFNTIHATCHALLGLGSESGKTRIVNTGGADPVWVEFCRKHGIRIGEKEEVTEDTPAEEYSIVSDEPPGGLAGKVSSFISFARNRNPLSENFIDAAKQFDRHPYTEITPDNLNWWTQKWLEWIREKNVFDYGRMLEECLRHGNYPPVDVLILDEGQDTSPLQMELVKMWGEHTRINYAAFDKDQAIYGFQGADPSLVDGLQPVESEIHLLESHRCPSKIIDAAKRLISRNAVRTGVDYYSKAAVQPGVIYRDLDIPFNRIIDYYKQGETSYILARNIYMLGPVVNRLMNLKIPFHNLKGFAGIPPKNEKIRVLVDLHCGGKADARELVTLILSLPGNIFQDFGKKGGRNRAAFEKTVMKRKGGSMRMAPTDLKDLHDRFGLLPDAVKKLENFYTGMTMIRDNQVSPDVKNYYVWMAKKYGVDFLKSAPLIELSTIHGVKGGQADNVFMMLGMSTRTWEGYQRDPEPERRVFYVGMTRAKKRLILVGNGFDEILTCL